MSILPPDEVKLGIVTKSSAMPIAIRYGVRTIPKRLFFKNGETKDPSSALKSPKSKCGRSWRHYDWAEARQANCRLVRKGDRNVATPYRPDIDSFEAMMAREECQKGIFISFDYTSDAMTEGGRVLIGSDEEDREAGGLALFEVVQRKNLGDVFLVDEAVDLAIAIVGRSKSTRGRS